MDEHDMENLINTEHQKQALYCEEHFVTNKKANGAFWTCLVLAISLCCTGVGWVLNESNKTSKIEVTVDRHDKVIDNMESMSKTMSTILAILHDMQNKK